MSFLQFAAASGLLIKSVSCDGRIHRCPTQKNPRAKNGAYMFDGTHGWCMDWSESGSVQWWNDANAKPWTDHDKKQWNANRLADEKRRLQGYESAAKKASQMLSECVIGSHAYLRSKQLPDEQGLIFTDGSLLIPMRDIDTNKVNGIQSIFINATGDGFDKKFLPGMRAKRSVYKVGKGRKIILVEGYATAISVHAAVKQMHMDMSVICCFSASNMVQVAKTHGHFVMADNDRSKTGEKSAIETGLPWHMPVNEGMDWNDVHAESGLISVCVALKDLVREVA